MFKHENSRTNIKDLFFFILIFRFQIDSLIVCSLKNFFVNNLCATETYAISFFKINVIFAFLIFFINSSLFSVDFQKFVSFDRKIILNLRILNKTTKPIFSAIFCNEKALNFVIITIIFFWFSKRLLFSHYVQILSMRFLLKRIFIFSLVTIMNAAWFSFFEFVCSLFFSLFFYFFRFIFLRNLNGGGKQRDNINIWHMIQCNDFTIIFFIKKQLFCKINVYIDGIYSLNDNKSRRKNRNKFKINRKNEYRQLDKILQFFEKFNTFTLIIFYSHMHLKSFRALRYQKNSSIDNMNTLRHNIFLKEETVFFKNMIIFKTVQTFVVCEFRKVVFWKTMIQFGIRRRIILIKKIKSLNKLHTVNCLNLKDCDNCFCFKIFHNLNRKRQRKILNMIDDFLHECINI